MALTFAVIDPVTTSVGSYTDRFHAGDTHSLIIEQPPGLAIRQFYSWAQNGVVEVLGGRGGRAFVIECWIHDQTLTTLQLLDDHLLGVDRDAGMFGNLKLTVGSQTLQRNNCRFIGFQRVPFDGQRRAEPLPVLGVHDPSAYGAWHIAGELHFFQLSV